MDLVAKAITKGVFDQYYEATKPCEMNKYMDTKRKNFAVIDTETTWTDEVMSIGLVIADGDTQDVIAAGYYIISPECDRGGMYSDSLYFEDVDVCLISERRFVLEEIRRVLEAHNVDRIMAYNAAFDLNHLPEFGDYIWCDIMKLAANKKYNDRIPANAECFKNGKMKRGYGVENILRMLLDNNDYFETHNAFYDAVDEMKIVKLLGHSIDVYDVAKISKAETVAGKFNREADCKSVSHVDSDKTMLSMETTSISETCSADEAAQILGVSRSIVYKLIRNGQIYAIKKKNKYCVSIDSINKYIKRKRIAAIGGLLFSVIVVALILHFIMGI